MAQITYLEAIREALIEEMDRDPSVFCLGEDIGRYGGAFKVTEGLSERFGDARVIDSPISEVAIVGAAAGAAHMGMRPVVEMQFIDFVANAYDMLTNYVATARYRAFLPCPMVVRGPSGGYVRGGPFHSQNPEAGFVHTPGLKVVYPATATDAKGLMKAAIRDDDCVLFFEHKYLYRRIKDEMPVGDHVVPIGKARVAREGTDVSIITYAATVWKSIEAAEQVEREDGLSVEVIDLRTLAPLDDSAIQATVHKTNRALVVHEDTRTGGFAGEIIARINGDVVRLARRTGDARDGARRASAVRARAGGFRPAADERYRARDPGGRRLLTMTDSSDEAAVGGFRDYLGVGCLTVAAGLAGGGMIAVLVAKIVGAIARCPSDAETGAPCNWLTYAVFGALIGAVLLPVSSIWSLRRARRRAARASAANSERG